ncbi:MAG: FKBP-type peptidyl-prolyl cis-trans isomerase [Cyclobacteriaceae bacterium]
MKPIRRLNLLLFSLLIISCTTAENVSQVPEVKFIGETSGKKIQEGQIVTFHMLYKTLHDQVLADTKLMGGPVSIIRDDSIWQKSGMFYQALRQMGEGDSANFIIPANNFYTKSGETLPDILNEDDSLFFQVKIISIK